VESDESVGIGGDGEGFVGDSAGSSGVVAGVLLLGALVCDAREQFGFDREDVGLLDGVAGALALLLQ
jgi:hypothetical protein